MKLSNYIKVKLLPVIMLSTLVMVTDATAAIITQTAFDSGWYKSDGFHNTTNQNNFTGIGTIREENYEVHYDQNSFFKFDTEQINAQLQDKVINSVSITFLADGDFLFESLSVFHVNAVSFDDTVGVQQGADIHTDLGTNQYGYTEFSAGSGPMTTFSVLLDIDDFITETTNNWFTVGGSLTTNGEYSIMFDHSLGDVSNNVTLAIDFSDAPSSPNPIPEPSILVLMGLGLLGMIGINRRKFQA